MSENKLGLEAQPVPPIFQPELAADAIHFAAHHHRRREVLLGTSTIKAILGQKLIPGLLDRYLRYLAAKGYDGQTTGAPLRRPRASNLFEPVPGDHGAHGDFELRARDRDLLARVGVWLGSAGLHAVAAAFGVGVVVGASALIARGRR